MRPGRYRPGFVCWRCGSSRGCLRFNEAGAISPRIRRRSRSTTSGATCFNEAGAISPRIHWEGCPEPWICQGFNEAGAISPRIRGRRRRLDLDLAVASMRPGRYRPGFGVGRKGEATPGGASMRPGRYRPGFECRCCTDTEAGLRFNEAGAISPRIHAAEEDACGHCHASMRPGRYRPGFGLEASSVAIARDGLQ